MKSLFIAGTDTDVGKTVVTLALASYWQEYGSILSPKTASSLGIFKLIQTGVGDWELYRRLFESLPDIEIVVPIRFREPLAPPIAAAKENREIDLAIVWKALQNLQQQRDLVLIEALGGLGSPVTEEITVANLAADWHLPTVLVVPVKLGSIAQAVANVALARSLNIELKGIILNCCDRESQLNLDDLTPIDLIESLTQIPVIGTLPYAIDVADKHKLAQIVANWDLELIFLG
jgi:dethiobiotin synthetase